MSSLPKFYLPIILPPLKDQSHPPAYYASLDTQVTANFGVSDGSLEIAITNANQLHPGNQFDHPVPFSTVFAPTSGFVRFYENSAALPPMNDKPMDLPPGHTNTTDLGSLVIRVWINDYLDFNTAMSTGRPHPNGIVLSWLQTSEIENFISKEIAKQTIKVLEKSWKDEGGTGKPPDRMALEAAFLQRFMAGKAEVFVSSGAILGLAFVDSSVAKLKLQAFFAPANPPSVFVEADDLIENANTNAVYKNHPLLQATNAPINIKFKSKFTIWNNESRRYEALATTAVALIKAPDILIDFENTDADGRFASDFEALMMKRDLIFFRYSTIGKTVGNRTFTEDLDTDPHLARLYLNSDHENTKEYRANYEIYPAFRDFVDQLADNADTELFERDRGNGATWDKSSSFSPKNYAFTFSSQKGFLMRVRDSEKRYKDRADDTSKMFSLLVEGDSWLSYPPDGHGLFTQYSGDIYGQLDQLLSDNLETPKLATYIRFPLQHHGDRIDQMFLSDPLDPTRQWHFTRKFLREYHIDAIVCSAGGNDIAEPGISHWTLNSETDIGRALSKCFTDSEFSPYGDRGYFDPTKMDEMLTTEQREVAKRLMEKSFAILLIDHPWNRFGRTGELEKPDILWKDLPGWSNLGENGLDSTIGAKVITNIQDFKEFPDPTGNDQQKLLATVFDSDRYRTRFDEVRANWEILLTEAQERGTRVVSHTYCYPIFNQDPTNVLSLWQTGPWFGPRFNQAGISDFRIRYVCLKALLDNYKYCVLDKLTTDFPDTFEYVDVRDKTPNADLWSDEMHLRSAGFKLISTRLYNKLATIIKERLDIELPKEPE